MQAAMESLSTRGRIFASWAHVSMCQVHHTSRAQVRYFCGDGGPDKPTPGPLQPRSGIPGYTHFGTLKFAAICTPIPLPSTCSKGLLRLACVPTSPCQILVDPS